MTGLQLLSSSLVDVRPLEFCRNLRALVLHSAELEDVSPLMRVALESLQLVCPKLSQICFEKPSRLARSLKSLQIGQQQESQYQSKSASFIMLKYIRGLQYLKI